MIMTFAAARNITERSAWRSLKAAVRLGWVRCLQHAAPGYRARYQLQVPVDLVVPGLPEDLEEALRLWDSDALPEPDDADSYHGHLSQAPIAPVSLEPPADPFPAPHTAPDTTPDSGSPTECQTSPYIAKALSPLWGDTFTIPGETGAHEIEESWRPSRRRREPSSEELAAARQVLARCRRWWQHQRGAAGVLSARELEGLVEPTALALRRATASELVEAITVQCRSARSLAALVGHRLWRIIKTRVEWDQARLPVLADGWRADEEHGRYAALVAHQAQLPAWNRAGAAPARTAIEETRRRTARRTVEEAAAQPSRSWHREPEADFHAVLEQPEEASPLEVYRARVERSQLERWERRWR
ncbi:hypothetical protein DR950_41800 [Kitasatospora xanthocidica]|uniref:Uncharacterized protein n=1 Tax=Kitasatospora xanthocidica TaxID=83382 RepID=A0A372ZIX0_9ACTN|nr:hypothetical protein [Kitasatospora xanthocidica]RGD55400.1 hypothetical protein DR950_41800 [Kitasatospora xanthocidica]